MTKNFFVINCFKEAFLLPKYNYEDFRKACGRKKGVDVVVFDTAQNDAGEFFNLYTKKELMSFIFNDGFENITHFSSPKHWHLPDIFIDEYEFRILGKTGCLAFFYFNGKWVVKSFHLSKTRFSIMADNIIKILEKRRKND